MQNYQTDEKTISDECYETSLTPSDAFLNDTIQIIHLSIGHTCCERQCSGLTPHISGADSD